jgi:hypothetical protein
VGVCSCLKVLCISIVLTFLSSSHLDPKGVLSCLPRESGTATPQYPNFRASLSSSKSGGLVLNQLQLFPKREASKGLFANPPGALPDHAGRRRSAH